MLNNFRTVTMFEMFIAKSSRSSLLQPANYVNFSRLERRIKTEGISLNESHTDSTTAQTAENSLEPLFLIVQK